MAAKKKKNYFTEDTENAIVQYNLTTSLIDRNKIYDQHIKYPFDKLAENIIHTFKFYHFDIPYEDVKHEVVAFLNEKIHKYTQGKGKAFSYFSIVAKNYLINHNNNNYNKFKNTDALDVVDSHRKVVNEIIRETDIEHKREFMDVFVEYVDNNLNILFKSKEEIQVADSILELFKQRNNIEEYNKKALYILIRERTGMRTQYITKIVNQLKRMYFLLFREYKITGNINPEALYQKDTVVDNYF
jgi:hypothetical protein